MIRLLGILSGSALAVALLIATLGVPDTAPQEIAVAPPPAPVTVAPEPQPGIPAPQASEVATLPTPPPEINEQPAPETHEPPSPVVADTPEVSEEHWYAFWSPFNSQLAANGFIAQLQRTTGLDYRVVKLKPGVYEVAFAYSDESDIKTRLAQISSATGLEIPGG